MAGVATDNGFEENFSGDVLQARDPVGDEICIKDGAGTGLTAGRFHRSETYLFLTGTSDSLTDAELETRCPGSASC
jgi:hypothetical protein